jgi:hypothetical protein
MDRARERTRMHARVATAMPTIHAKTVLDCGYSLEYSLGMGNAATTKHASEDDIRTAEARGAESALADHRAGVARWPFSNSALGLSPRQAEIQTAWARSKRDALVGLGHRER